MSLHLITGYAGVEHIQSQDQGSFNIATFGGDQFVLDHGNKFEATLLAGNAVRIKDGDMLMQGRHIRLSAGTTEDVTIENGTQGMLRKDLICVRYTKSNSTGVEDASFVVIKGTDAASDPSDPEYNEGTITDGTDLINDFPIYRVSLNGTELILSDPLFDVKGGILDTLTDLVDFMEDDFILINKQALTFTNKVCTLSNSKITADSLADVYFTNACMDAAIKAGITVETSAGALTLTATRAPESTLTATIRIKVV